jgi:hypothetical protein
MLGVTHRALVTALGIPEHDRYQIVHEHPASHFVIEDTGLDIKRRKNWIVPMFPLPEKADKVLPKVDRWTKIMRQVTG